MARSPHSPILAALLVGACLLLAPGLGLAQDTDNDLMPDSYETAFGCLMPNTVDAGVDYDADSMTSLEEYNFSPLLNPCDPDTEGDALPDGWEQQYASCGFDPLSWNVDENCIKFGSDFLMSGSPGSASFPSLSWTGSEFGVSWYDNRDGNPEIYFARVSADGAKIGFDLRVTGDQYMSYLPSLSWTGSEYGVSWDDGRNGNTEIYFARISVAGVKIGSDLRVTNNTSTSFRSSLVWTGSEFGVSWEDTRDGNYEIYFARISGAGAKIGSDLRLTNNSSISESPSLIWTGSEFGVSWHDWQAGDYEIYFARLAANGSKIGANRRVTYAAGTSYYPSLSWTGSEFGVSWQDDRDGNEEIYFARLAATGDTLGSDLRVTSNEGASQYPSLFWTGFEFGVSWWDSWDGHHYIYFAHVSASGSKLGSNLQLTSGTTTSYSPSLLWTGSEFGVSWDGYKGVGRQIYLSKVRYQPSDKDLDGLREDKEFMLGTNPCEQDSDADGMDDGFEVNFGFCGLDPISPLDAMLDGDTDGLSNLMEYNLGGNPCDPDTDNDGMDDGFEADHASCASLNPLNPGDAPLDGDTDGLSNLNEYNHGTNPCDPDSDDDGMDDGFEVDYEICAGLDPLLPGGAASDGDTDGLSNLLEYNLGSNPCAPDTDSDGMEDEFEFTYSPCASLNLLDPVDAILDADTDGLSNLDEYIAGANPCAPDTDGDGMEDGFEVEYEICAGLDPLVPGNTALDGDTDGLSNLVEYNIETDPCDHDTDDDGLPDGWEYLYVGCGFDPIFYASEIASQKLGSDLRVTGNASEAYRPSLSWTGSEFGVSWNDDRDGNEEIYFARVSAAGTKIGADLRVTNEENNSYHPSLSWTGSEYCISWLDYKGGESGIYFARISSDGIKIGSDERVTNAGAVYGAPSLSWTGSEFGVSWDDHRDGNFEIYFTRVSATGLKIGSDIRVTSNDSWSSGATLSWTGSEFGVCWEDLRDGNSEIYFARVSADGLKLGTDLRVTTYVDDSVSCSLSWTGSEFGLSWADYRDGNYEIYFARVSAEGFKIDSDFRVTSNESTSFGPSVLSWTGSEFGVTWDDRRDGQDEIYFARVSATGAKLGSDFRVTSNVKNSFDPSLAWTGSEFGVIWNDEQYWTHEIYFARVISLYTDKDADNFREDQEYNFGGNPCDPDSDDDGMDDGFEVAYAICAGLDLLAPGNTALDGDTDGLSNLAEFNLGTNPCDPDTDDDSGNDLIDCAKLDDAHWSDCGACVDVDHDDYGQNCDLGGDCDDNAVTGPSCHAGCGIYYQDADIDTHGDPANSRAACVQPAGYVSDNTDCSDSNAYAWNACATCHDEDTDSYYELCDRYFIASELTIGSGIDTWDFPLDTYYHDARTQVIYLASEIGTAGTITAVALDVDIIPGQTMENFTIRMKPTALNSYSNYSWEGPSSGWVTVFQNNEPPGATGWRTFTFSTPFCYDGISNLMIDFCFNNSSWSTAGLIRYTDSGVNRALFYSSDSEDGDPLNWTGTLDPIPWGDWAVPNLGISFAVPPPINGPDCNDAANTIFPLAPELCDTIDNQCPGNPGYGVIDEGCVVDTDGDGLNDNDETTIYFTDPNDPDSDHDGIDDGDEVNTYGTNPNAWDTDGDYLPDPFELANAANPAGPLDATSAIDGDTDFEPTGQEDGNPNYHEYWNGSDPWAKDPVPDRFQSPACYYWVEGDGDGVPGPGDLAVVKDKVATGLPTYMNVLPRGVFDTQDVDKDGVPGPGDISSVKDMVTGIDLPSGYPSMPVSLGVVSAPGGAVDVGDTCHVTLEVVNQALAVTRSGAFAVVFSIDPSSTGAAVLLGGEGEDLGQSFTNRYDVSGLSTAGGRANIVLKLTGAGTVIVRAKVPACGIGTTGRWCAEVLLSPSVTITAQ